MPDSGTVTEYEKVRAEIKAYDEKHKLQGVQAIPPGVRSGSSDGSSKLDQIQKALEAGKALLGASQKIKQEVESYVIGLGFLERELERTHATMQAKIHARADVTFEQKTLEALQDNLIVGLESYTSAIQDAIKRNAKDVKV